MQKTTLSFIFLILAIGSQVLASNLQLIASQQVYAISYEKTYTILINGERTLDFVIYPPENGTAVFNQISPVAQAYEVQESSFMQYTIGETSFTLCFDQLKENYCIIRLETNGNVKIADPETVQTETNEENEQVASTNITELQEQINKLQSQINDLQNQINQLSQQIGSMEASGGISEEKAQKIAQAVVEANSQVIKREITDSIVQDYLNPIMQKLNELEKSKNAMQNNPVFMQLMQDNPQTAILMVILDPSASEEDKQQALMQLIALQQEAKRRRTLLIAGGITIPSILVMVMLLWKWKQKQMSPMSFPGMK